MKMDANCRIFRFRDPFFLAFFWKFVARIDHEWQSTDSVTDISFEHWSLKNRFLFCLLYSVQKWHRSFNQIITKVVAKFVQGSI